MPTGRVQNRDEVWLNGRLFKIRGQVQRQIANQFAEKTVIGDFTEESDPVLSQITWNDLSGGMGQYLIKPSLTEEETAVFNRYWYGNVRNQYPQHLIPQNIRAKIGGRDSNGTATLDKIRWNSAVQYKNGVAGQPNRLVASMTDTSGNDIINVHSSAAGQEFKASVANGPLLAMKAGMVSGVRTLVGTKAPSGIQWTRSNMAGDSVWVEATGDSYRHFAFWRDLMWGLDSDGQLAFSASNDSGSTNLNWTQVTTADAGGPEAYRDLLTGEMIIPGREDKEHLFLVRNDGVDIYDRLNEKLEPVFRLPVNDHAGLGALVWNGRLFYSHGISIYQWEAETGRITDVGPSAGGEGMPSSMAGWVYSMGSTPWSLYATITQTDTALTPSLLSRTAHSGWTTISTPAESSFKPYFPMFVGPFADGSSRGTLVFPGWPATSSDGVTYHRYMPTSPETISTDSHTHAIRDIDSAAELVSPWIVADANQDWVAHKLSMEIQPLLSNSQQFSAQVQSSFTLDYATNFSDSVWTNAFSVANSTAASASLVIWPTGAFETTLPNDANPVGKPFTSFRWRAKWANILNNNVFDLNRVSLTFQKRPKLRYAFQFEIDMRGPSPQHYSPKEQREFLDEFFQQATLAEFTYHDEAPGGGQTYYVTPLSPTLNEETGNADAEGAGVRMTVMEVV